MKFSDEILEVGTVQVPLKQRFNNITPKSKIKKKISFLKNVLQDNISAQLYCSPFQNLPSA